MFSSTQIILKQMKRILMLEYAIQWTSPKRAKKENLSDAKEASDNIFFPEDEMFVAEDCEKLDQRPNTQKWNYFIVKHKNHVE